MLMPKKKENQTSGPWHEDLRQASWNKIIPRCDEDASRRYKLGVLRTSVDKMKKNK